MGAKLTKKKKGYCLGAGKDGESTETTEVEQKETQNQDGQKDANESNGEKPSTDQTETNGTNEGPVAEAEKQPSEEVPSGDHTKDDSKVDQTSDTNSSEKKAKTVEKIGTCTQEQCGEVKEGRESCAELPLDPQDQAVKALEVAQTVVVLEKNPVQETLVPQVHVKPAEEPKQTEQQEKPSAVEQKEPEIEQTHEVQNAPSEVTPDHSKQEPVQDTQSVVEVAKSEQSNVQTEEKAEEPPKTEVVKIEPVNVQEPKGADMVVTDVEPEPTTAPQEAEPLAEELPPTSIHGTEPPSYSETISDQKPSEHESQGVDLQNAQEENVNVEVQTPTQVIEEQTQEVQNAISQNGPTEQCEPENIQGAPSDSAEQGTQDLKAEDNAEQNIPTVEESKPESVTEVPSSQQNRKNHSNPEIVISLPMSEGPDKSIHDLYEESQNADLQNEEESQIAEIQNEEVINEKVSSDPQQTNDKHLIGNGLPIKEETQVKETLENESDNAIGEVNGQSHEIMCSE